MSRLAEIEAYCAKCEKVTAHKATFTGRFLKERTCLECGSKERSSRTRLLRAYADELLDRALSKPYRLRQEWKMDHREVIHSLPIRVLRRPFLEAKYLADLLASNPAEELPRKEKDSGTQDDEPAACRHS